MTAPRSIWKELAYVSVNPMYWMEVAVMSQRAGGKNTNGLYGLADGSSTSSMLEAARLLL